METWMKDFAQQYPNQQDVKIDDVSDFIFSSLGITSARDSVRFSSLIRHKSGNCVTISLLYFALTQNTQLALHVIQAPQHFFLRSYADSIHYINTEPTQNGMHLQDSFYIRSRDITSESMLKGCYMRPQDVYYLNNAYRNNLAVLLQSRGSCEKAISVYSASLEAYPAHPETLVNRGDCYRNLELYLRAISDYNAAIELYSADPGYYWRRAIAYVNIGKCEEAIDDFTEVLLHQPGDPAILVNRGKAYYNCQELDQACQDWELAMKADDEEAQSLVRRHCKK
jgi:tetratricopeptide (TPR) repeat protein